jgi:hypothetical protein
MAVGSAVAKRAFFATPSETTRPLLSWRQQQLLGDRRPTESSGPEIVRVRCGNTIHRLRLFADGGPAALLDHPHLDRKTELALMALGAPRPDCLLIFDAITGRASTRRILWRRRAYPIAARAAARRRCRRPGPPPSLEQSLLERYANFVRHRASLWLDRLLPTGTHFEVVVIPPPSVDVKRPSADVWAWQQRPGYSLKYWGGTVLEVRVPFDWHASVEKAHGLQLQTGFIIDAREDRRGQMIQRLEIDCVYGASRYTWMKTIYAVDSTDLVSPLRWRRARRSCLIVIPDRCQIISKGVHSQ